MASSRTAAAASQGLTPAAAVVLENVDKAFAAAGLASVRAQSRATGLNAVTLWRRGRAGGGFKLDELVAIASATGVPLVELVDGAEALR